MTKEDFFEALGGLDCDLVEEAGMPAKRRTGPRAWAALAACLAVAVLAAAVIPRTAPEEPGQYEGDTAIATSSISIYYLAEDGSLTSEDVELRCVPEEIFDQWAALNGVSGVEFVSCTYDSGGSESLHGSVAEYTVGDHFTLRLTVSAGFSAYAQGENGDLLVQSLRQTFCDYLRVDEFILDVDG